MWRIAGESRRRRLSQENTGTLRIKGGNAVSQGDRGSEIRITELELAVLEQFKIM